MPDPLIVPDHPLLEAALQYAALSRWAVFPVHGIVDGHCTCSNWETCEQPGKHPRVKGGFKAATTDLDQIRRWWARWPDANVAIATGRVSGIMVLDIDGREGIQGLTKLVKQYGPLPETCACVTARGFHIYFALNSDWTTGSSVQDGIDVRCEGGYVLAPPSLHHSGHVYRWGRGMWSDNVAG